MWNGNVEFMDIFFFFSDLWVLCDFYVAETVVWNDWWFVFLPQATTPSTLGSMCQRATGEGDVTRERQATEKRRKRRESLRTILTSQMWRMRMSPAAASWSLSVSSPWGSFSFSIISSKKNPRADLLQNGLVGLPCSPRDSQESSPTPQFKSINSSVLRFLHRPTLTSIHDH